MISSQDFIQSKNDSIRSEVLGSIIFGKFFDDFSNVFSVEKLGEGEY